MIEDIHGLKPLEAVPTPVWPYFFYGLLTALACFGVFLAVLSFYKKRKK